MRSCWWRCSIPAQLGSGGSSSGVSVKARSRVRAPAPRDARVLVRPARGAPGTAAITGPPPGVRRRRPSPVSASPPRLAASSSVAVRADRSRSASRSCAWSLSKLSTSACARSTRSPAPSTGGAPLARLAAARCSALGRPATARWSSAAYPSVTAAECCSTSSSAAASWASRSRRLIRSAAASSRRSSSSACAVLRGFVAIRPPERVPHGLGRVELLGEPLVVLWRGRWLCLLNGRCCRPPRASRRGRHGPPSEAGRRATCARARRRYRCGPQPAAPRQLAHLVASPTVGVAPSDARTPRPCARARSRSKSTRPQVVKRSPQPSHSRRRRTAASPAGRVSSTRVAFEQATQRIEANSTR